MSAEPLLAASTVLMSGASSAAVPAFSGLVSRRSRSVTHAGRYARECGYLIRLAASDVRDVLGPPPPDAALLAVSKANPVCV